MRVNVGFISYLFWDGTRLFRSTDFLAVEKLARVEAGGKIENIIFFSKLDSFSKVEWRVDKVNAVIKNGILASHIDYQY